MESNHIGGVYQVNHRHVIMTIDEGSGIIAGIHTFGAGMNFNPHIHMIVTMGGMKKNGEWKTYDYTSFKMLRKQWQTVALKLIRRKLNDKEKKKVQPLLQKAYSDYKGIHGYKYNISDVR
jgi:hypothetical protein